ncbi:hypothetical protein U9M48_040712, partial [Paspalum notatum var. saurae]
DFLVHFDTCTPPSRPPLRGSRVPTRLLLAIGCFGNRSAYLSTLRRPLLGSDCASHCSTAARSRTRSTGPSTATSSTRTSASDLRDKFEANRHVVKPSRADSCLHLPLGSEFASCICCDARFCVWVVQDNLDVIDRLIDDAEAQYRNFQHPDPY